MTRVENPIEAALALDLLPCPFCGGEALLICETEYPYNKTGAAFAASCRMMECHGAIFTLAHGLFPTRAEAIAAWNTRASPHLTERAGGAK